MDRTNRQKLGIKRWVEKKCCASLCYATGTGKTFTAIMAIQLLLKHKEDAYVIICVPTQFLKDQWIGQLTKYGLTSYCDVIIVNTIIRHTYTCDLLVIDEAHRVASETFSQIFDTVTYTYILCLTATMERLDGKEVLIKKYAPICDTITLQEAVKEGWVSSVKNYLVMLNVDLTEYKELDRKFNSYFAFFEWDYNSAMKSLQDWKYRNAYAKRLGIAPKMVMSQSAQWMKCLHARKDFIENHPKKIEVCRQILDARKDKKCITFCPTIKFAENIKRGSTLHSGKKESENKKTIEDFNKASSGVLNSSKALNEGVDLKGLSVGIRMNINSSKITSIQQNGRICRFEPGKTAEMFTIVLAGTQEVKWFNNSNTTDYIVIDSPEKLNKILNYEEIESRKRDFISDTMYRF